MKKVLDASVGFKWVVHETDSDKALRLRDDYRNSVVELIAPDFYPAEVAHSITRAERQGRITLAQGATALRDTLNLLPQLHNYLPLLPRAYALSSPFRIGIFDCIYAALAEQEGCDLVTADARLVNALQAHFPFIVALSALP
jgi:predicted nucleic acid-binding protein